MTKLSKLEEEMFFAIHGFGPMDGGNTADNELQKELEQQAKAAAQVAHRWIEDIAFKVMNEDYAMGGHTIDERSVRDLIEMVMGEAGLTPSEPLKEEEGIIASNGLQNPEFETK